MIDINPNTYAKNCVHTIEVIKKDNKSVLWINMHDIQDTLGVRGVLRPIFCNDINTHSGKK